LLNRNENSYGTSPNIQMAMESTLKLSNRFPETAFNTAVQEIAGVHGVRPNQVLMGCGSTDVMRMCADAFLRPGATLITADPTFAFLQDYAAQLGSTVVRIPLNHRYEHDLDRMLARADRFTNLMYICNPNNPTGTITPVTHLERFLAKLAQHTYVLIDEAYHHYAGISREYSSWIERAASDPRLIVTRTFSKVYGLAGMRVGYAVASESTLRRLVPYRLWSGVNLAAAVACNAALKDKSFVQLAVKRNSDNRQEFFNQAQARVLKPLDSHTNFFFMDVGRPAHGVIAHFKKHNILIGPEFPSMSTFIRVTFGLPKEMLAFWRVWDLLPRGKMMM
jgi:histidinol-phosphate aminotransferase